MLMATKNDAIEQNVHRRTEPKHGNMVTQSTSETINYQPWIVLAALRGVLVCETFCCWHDFWHGFLVCYDWIKIFVSTCRFVSIIASNVNNRVWRIRFQRSADESQAKFTQLQFSREVRWKKRTRLAPLAGGGARGWRGTLCLTMSNDSHLFREA